MSHPGSTPRFTARILLLAAFAGLFTGCATVERIGTPQNYTACAAANVGTALLAGHAASAVIPLAGLAVAGYYALKALDRPAVTGAVTIAACAGAVHNVYAAATASSAPATAPVATLRHIRPGIGPMIRPVAP